MLFAAADVCCGLFCSLLLKSRCLSFPWFVVRWLLLLFVVFGCRCRDSLRLFVVCLCLFVFVVCRL